MLIQEEQLPVWKKLMDRASYKEYRTHCKTADITPLPIGEFAKMTGVLIVASILYKNHPLMEAAELILDNKFPSEGLGDTIAKITSAVGIQPCGGCKKRQEVLNTVFPYMVSK